MKSVAAATLVGPGAMIIGDIMPWDNPMLIQCGALSILAWTMWYLQARVIPALLKTIRDERDALAQAQERDRRATRKVIKKLAKSIDRLNKTP